MVLVKQVNEKFCEDIEERINEILKELGKDNKKIIDIKYTYHASMYEMSALIIYEE